MQEFFAYHEKAIRKGSAECYSRLTAMDDALYAIGGKWKLRIINALFENNKRFNELQRSIPGLSPKVLSNNLQQLELNGFVKRNSYAGEPAVIEYELTTYSYTLHEAVDALCRWGKMHRQTVQGRK
jgi:DNA-binding HxlR family transcriptional regulator